MQNKHYFSSHFGAVCGLAFFLLAIIKGYGATRVAMAGLVGALGGSGLGILLDYIGQMYSNQKVSYLVLLASLQVAFFLATFSILILGSSVPPNSWTMIKHGMFYSQVGEMLGKESAYTGNESQFIWRADGPFTRAQLEVNFIPPRANLQLKDFAQWLEFSDLNTDRLQKLHTSGHVEHFTTKLLTWTTVEFLTTWFAGLLLLVAAVIFGRKREGILMKALPCSMVSALFFSFAFDNRISEPMPILLFLINPDTINLTPKTSIVRPTLGLGVVIYAFLVTYLFASTRVATSPTRNAVLVRAIVPSAILVAVFSITYFVAVNKVGWIVDSHSGLLGVIFPQYPEDILSGRPAYIWFGLILFCLCNK